jgi:hypothetical protein
MVHVLLSPSLFRSLKTHKSGTRVLSIEKIKGCFSSPLLVGGRSVGDEESMIKMRAKHNLPTYEYLSVPTSLPAAVCSNLIRLNNFSEKVFREK